MNPIPSLLAAALLVVALPNVATASTEADLSPPLNGNSGHMPSGYSTLNFYVGNGYWAPDIRLPVQPSAGDRVMADTLAEWDARFSLQGTTFAAAGGTPFRAGDTLHFSWSAASGTWDIREGGSARALIGSNRAEDTVAASNHRLTQYTMEDGGHVGRLTLPAWAPDQALLAVANRAQWPTQVVSGGLSAADSRCAGGHDCVYAYNGATARWTRAQAGTVIAPASQLPYAHASVMNVVTRAVDVAPTQMTLPASAVHGDVYSFLHTHAYDSYRVLPAHTDQPAPVVLPTGKEVRFSYDRIGSVWRLVR